MKRPIIFFLSLIIAAGATAQVRTANDIANLITVDKLKEYLTVLTSDEFEGRETSTPGEEKAANYIAAHMRQLGLKQFRKAKNYLQYYKLKKDSTISASIRFGDNTYDIGDHFAMSTGSAFNQKAKADGIVFVGYGISDSAYDDYKDKDVKGKFVFFVSGEPLRADSNYLITGTKKRSDWSQRGEPLKLKEAKRRGARGVITFSQMSPVMNAMTRRFMIRNTLRFKIAEVALNTATLSHALFDSLYGKDTFKQILDAAKKRQRLNEMSVKNIDAEVALRYKEDVEKKDARNVVAYIEGSEFPDEYVFLTAHMDHLGTDGKDIYRGADDDGSGTSGVMAIANAIATAAKDGLRPKRSIIFMTVSGEEKGLWGSEYATDNPLVPLDKVSIDVNIDMIGRIDPKRKYGDSTNYTYVVGSDKRSAELAGILDKVNNSTVALELDKKYDDPNDKEDIFFRSDHYNFAKRGVPILFFFNGSHADYHRPTDTIDKINWGPMEKRARLAFYTLWEMANMDRMLNRDLPIPTQTRNR